MTFTKKNLITLSLFLLVLQVSSETLVEMGWDKEVDDFEGTVAYRQALMGSRNCDGERSSMVAGIVLGEPKNTNLSLGLIFYKADEIRREGKLQWKSDSGNESIPFVCSNEYEDGGWNRQCIAMNITPNLAETLGNTSFIRINFSGHNIDLNSDTAASCAPMLDNFKEVASEYSSAVN